MTRDSIDPNGYCHGCNARLLPGLHFCGPACAHEWTRHGAAVHPITHPQAVLERMRAVARDWMSRSGMRGPSTDPT